MITLPQSSLSKLQEAHSDLVRVVMRAAQITNVRFVVFEANRTQARQRQLVADGNSRTMRSNHIGSRWPDGKSRAVDLVPLEGNTPVWSWPLINQLAPAVKRAAQELGVGIRWGGDWRSFKDGPHWELTNLNGASNPTDVNLDQPGGPDISGYGIEMQQQNAAAAGNTSALILASGISGCAGARMDADATDAVGTANEGQDNPFGTSADGQALARATGDTGASDSTEAPASSASTQNVSCSGLPETIPDSYRVGKYFTVADLSSATASSRHVIPQNRRREVVCRLLYLMNNTIDPLVDYLRPKGMRIMITSGFRNGDGGSDHDKGSAVDFHVFRNGSKLTGENLTRVCKLINEHSNIPFTQMIHEADRVIHLACSTSGNARTKVFWSRRFGTFSGAGYRHNVDLNGWI